MAEKRGDSKGRVFSRMEKAGVQTKSLCSILQTYYGKIYSVQLEAGKHYSEHMTADDLSE